MSAETNNQMIPMTTKNITFNSNIEQHQLLFGTTTTTTTTTTTATTMLMSDTRLLEASASGQTDQMLQLIEEHGQELHNYKDLVIKA
jgi:hypothetical protein